MSLSRSVESALAWLFESDDLPPEVEAMMERMGRSQETVNGFEDRVNGLLPFILSLLAAAGCALVFLGKTSGVPLDGRQILFAACGLYGLGALMTLISPWPTISCSWRRKSLSFLMKNVV